jgi:hypothetical protein
LLPACLPELRPGAYRCNPSERDPCPAGHACLELGPDHRCFAQWTQTCGNGELEPGEQCDGTDLGGFSCADYGLTGPISCTPTCRVACGECGDGVRSPELGEECDEGAGNSWAPNATCRPDCRAARCGDGIRDDDRNEQCDGLGGGDASCESLGFQGGVLGGCLPTCRHDTSACFGFCGDGMVSDLEECDGLAQRGDLTCRDLGFTGGRLGCDARCRRTDERCFGGQWRPVYQGAISALTAAWGDEATGLWLAGTGADVFRHDAGGVIPHPLPAMGVLRLFGTPGGAILAATQSGLFRRDPQLQVWEAFGPETEVLDVWGTSDANLYAATIFGLYHFDGVAWNVAVPSPEYIGFNAVWGSGPDDVWATGLLGTFHFDGETWLQDSDPIAGPFGVALWGSGPEDLYLAADALWHRDANGWSAVSDLDEPVQFLSGSGPDDVYAAAPPLLWHWDGRSWAGQSTGLDAGERQTLRGVHVASAGEVYAFGGDPWGAGVGGFLHRWDPPGYWESGATGSATDLRGVFQAAPGVTFAVGSAGTVLVTDGAAWRAMDSGTTANLWSVHGTSAHDLWAVGDGAILHFDGTAWAAHEHPVPEATLFAVWSFGPDEVYAAWGPRFTSDLGPFLSQPGGLLRYDGSQWSPAPGQPPDQKSLFGLWGAPDGAIFAAGMGGLYRIQDHQWTVVCTSGVGGMISVWGTTSHDVTARTTGMGQPPFDLLHFDGTGCRTLPVTVEGRIEARIGGAASDLLLTPGPAGTLLHFDGTGWAPLSTGTDRALLAVAAISHEELYAVGADGTLLRLSHALPRVPGGPCARTVDIYCQSELRGSTAGQARANASYPGCAWRDTPGGEVCYRLQNPVTGMVRVLLTPLGGDLDLAVLRAEISGPPEGTCVAAGQELGPVPEELLIEPTLRGETYFLVVDDPDDEPTAFSLSVSCVRRQP